jgi:hypothetical protein
VTAFRLGAEPGDPERPNEDFAGALGDCAILLDGSGAPGDMPTGCIHGVPWFVRQLGGRCLAVMATSGPELSLADILAGAIVAVSDRHCGTCDLDCPGTPSSVLAMTRQADGVLDWLVLGDCTLVIDGAAGLRAISDSRMAAVAAEEYQRVLSLPTGTPEHQAARVAYVRKQQPLRNRAGGYPVASTDPDAAHQALTGNVPAASVRRIAMVSDGVSRFAEFGLGEWTDLLDIISDDGPGELFMRIRLAEDTDPAGVKWPRAKRHDDVSAVFWERTT